MTTSALPEVDLPGGTTAVHDEAAEEAFWEVIADPSADDPYTGYRLIRERAPVLRTGDGTLVLTGHAGCDAALRHRALGKGPQMFELQFTDLPPDQLKRMLDRVGDSMLMANPPEHTRLRRLVSDAFTPRHVADLTAAVNARAEQFLDPLTEAGGGDFMRVFAMAFPMNVIADLLGVPDGDRDYLTPLLYTATALLSPGIDPETAASALNAQAEATDYFTGLLADRRARSGDDLLSRLVRSRERDALTDEETISTALILFGAGFETTTNLLGNSLHALMHHPGQLARLAARPDTIPAAVEEFLRYDPPFQLDVRIVLEPLAFAGARLEPGQMVITVLGAANHDPAVYTDPESLDTTRYLTTGTAAVPHMSFASGIHYCLGAHLTRLELVTALTRLLARHPAPRPAAPPTRRPGLALRGYNHLPVRLDPA
ncbi:cytochrome P450 [Actinomadura sp. WMMB 499]|uniref:cytochrome P450 n=1 Tax=Actinomadura sp. WMMB 499 TaxID=1219491 RepID=UPI00124847D2|nr:cytochrome P450 [Actinomadura sp. WMMB 499]QFG24558.1 cytochrome P450 [Actinomadura sp. WMMB 499]